MIATRDVHIVTYGGPVVQLVSSFGSKLRCFKLQFQASFQALLQALFQVSFQALLQALFQASFQAFEEEVWQKR